MKSSKMKKMKKRILAMLLCTTMMLNTGVSALADEVVSDAHVHTETCYEKHNTGNLVCTKAEVTEAEAHVHADECYEVTSTQELTCTLAETEGHSHGDGCVETKDVLICGKDEHTHGDECYKEETIDVCTDDSEEHTCDDNCVETTKVLDCDAEHAHDGGCYTTETKIVCGQEEVEAHAHGEGCYTTVENKTQICVLEEVEAHTHGDDCYEWEENLVCTIPEGTPVQLNETETVQEPVEEQKEEVVEEETKEVTLQNDDETGIKVSIESTSDVLEEGTKVVVDQMELDETMENALAEAAGEFEVLGYVAYDISLKNADDADVELGKNTVDVTIDFEEAIPEEIDAEKVKEVVLAHITTDEDENVVAETVGTVEITEEKATVEFEAESFSPYIVTYLGEAEEVVEEPVVEDIVLTYTSEDGKYTVTATAKPEIMENVAALEATLITETTKVEEIAQKLIVRATETKKTSLGFEAFEYKFFDAEGNEVAVNGEVKISLSYEEAMIPEAADAENVDAVETALLETAEEGFDEINGLVSAEAGAVKEVIYTTEAPEELILAWSGDVYRTLPNYEDDEVVITLAGTEYALQNVVGFNVTPIKEDNEETKEQYAEVAQQLEEKIAEENEAKEEKAVVGFLAYDITLVDVEGNELEPQGGVRVSMEYKEAAAPEAVAETPEAEVTIHHFEEDEKGEVRQIVDMVAEETIEATVEVTKAAEVEKVEFVTEKFSVYTVTWTYSNTYTVTLKSHYGYLNDNGEFVEFTTEPTDKLSDISTNQNDRTVNLAEYTNQNVFETGDYTYDKAYIVKGDATYSNAISTTQLRLHYSQSGVVRLQYLSGYNNYPELFNVTSTTSDSDKVCSIYYVYKTPPKPITTVDSKAEHINIHVSDYSIWTESQKSWDHTVQYDINNGHSLKFVTTGNQLSSPAYNVYTGGATPRQGFLKKNLSGGYPQLESESLAYLFNTGYDANYLFKKVDGYYIYDSAQNFASLDTATGNFRVYSEPNTGFFPFNKFTENLKIESASTNTVENHHSGMHVDFTFMQPKNGKTADNADMIFEFSGDDDVWVFIGGVLVLDLGGIHQPTGGTINFATGEVTYTNATNTTIYRMYVDALKDQGITNAQAEAQAKRYFVEYETGKYRFKDYSQHELNFFYLERGAHDSNCKIKFNLISIPANSVFVEKKITKSNMADFADAEFKFKIEKKDVNDDGSYPNESSILVNTTYKLYEVDSAGNRTFIGERTTDGAGEFILKHRQVAEFSNIPASTKYCVTEVGVTSEVYDNVTLNGSDITIESTKTEGGLTKHDYVTGDLLAQDHVYVTFENQCNVTNLRNLIIRKEMAAGQTSTESFDMKVEFAEGDEWIPYVGNYYLGASTGDEMSTSNGIITLKPGQEAYVIGLISDTEYRVTEVLRESQKLNYGAPTYSGTGTVETINDVTYITDVIELNTSKDYMATVTNSLRMVVNVNKVWSDSENSHEPVYVGLYRKDGDNWKPNSTDSYKELKEGAWSTSFAGLNGGEYDVKELVPVTSADAPRDFTINETGYVATNDYYINDTYDYAVSYDRKIVQDTTNVTITNTRLGKILIEKVSKNDHDLKLQGAEFKLQKYDETKDIFVDIKTGVTDSKGTVTFEKLENGTYQIVEIKAPTGYALSDDHKIVELPEKEGAVVTYEANVIIENEALYELPSTGGNGIHVITLSGLTLMLGAAYVWFMNRREEILQ